MDLFLNQANLDYHQLYELMQVKFINPDGDQSQILLSADDCDTRTQKLNRMSPPRLDRIHRFLRLWRHTPWKMWELDLLIRSPKIGNGLLSEDCLIGLKRVREIQNLLKTDAEHIQVFYDNFSRESRRTTEPFGKTIPCLYDALFLNKSIINPVDPAFEDPDKSASPANRSDHRAAILAALGISDSDLTLLDSLPGNNQLTVANLSLLYRYALQAERLRVRIPELLRWTDVVDERDPFLNPAVTLEFLRKKEQVVQAGFSPDEFEYIRRYAFHSPLGLREETVDQHLSVLRTGLAKLQDSIFNASGSARENTAARLGKFAEFNNTEVLEPALDLIEGNWAGTDQEREEFIRKYFVFIRDIPSAVESLRAPVILNESLLTERHRYVLQQIFSFFRESLITEHISNALSIPAKHAGVLISRLSPEGSGPALYDVFDDLLNTDTSGNYLPFTDQHHWVFHLLHKCKIIIEKGNVTPEDLAWWTDHSNVTGIFQFFRLPVQTNDDPGNPFLKGDNALPYSCWDRWFELLRFRQRYPEPEGISFTAILEKATHNDTTLFRDLTTLTQLHSVQWEMLGKRLGLEVSDFSDGRIYRRLSQCLSDLNRTGASENMLFSWADRDNEDQEYANSVAIRQASKSKYNEKEWLELSMSLQNELRKSKRTALGSFLIALSQREIEITIGGQTYHNPYHSCRWNDNNDLFGYFLIDVDMNACMVTSRLKQAVSSVQLFVQRCFLNLEPALVKIPGNDPDLENSWSQWKWIKNYRIWEANRKVFLYPENWIEPELRDDKSPFFNELESELRQNELTASHAEAAFLNYLQKLDRVSRLEITGVYHETDLSVNRFHVVGRTADQAPGYFYRNYDLNYCEWSPWEKVEADITGDHVIPVVYNRKLYLFWLLFQEKPLKLKRTPPLKASDGPVGNPEQPRLLEIQLAWSTRSHTGWTGKKISKKKLIHPWDRPLFTYNLRPRYRATDNALMIDLFISTSKEFNDRLFYDQFLAAPKKFSTVNFNEMYRPWHSSSFVFDGEVRDIKLKGISGVYYLDSTNSLVSTSSHQYVQESFGQEGRQISPLRFPDKTPNLTLPCGMHFEYTRLVNNKIHGVNSSSMNIIEPGRTTTLLTGAKAPFEVVQSMQSLSHRPLFYQDNRRSFFVKPEFEQISLDYQTRIWRRRYVFYPFYHPYTELFIRELNRSGLDGFFNRNIQVKPGKYYPQNSFNFNSYAPLPPHAPHETAVHDVVDFSFGGAYSVYNWEVFFHAPLMIATLLSQNQRFEEAMSWFHSIFDPTNTEDLPVPQRYWVTKPFFEQNADGYRQQRIKDLLKNIDDHHPQIMAWRNNPFKPHLIARYRPVAYQRNVVMRYIRNLIDWGDMLFRRDNLESLNEATQLYVLAHEILGDRPDKVPAVNRENKSYNELTADQALDVFGNQKVEVMAENLAPMTAQVVEPEKETEPLPRLDTFYFCIPGNEKLNELWNLVEDRLFKIRNGMNIQGIIRQLPLFEPPIDPALLVKAAAQGLDLSSVMNDISAPAPHYRFKPLVAKAAALCSEVKAMGEKFLDILVAKDAEALDLLRQNQEIQLLEALKEVRKRQILEAEENRTGLERSKAVIEERLNFFADIEKRNRYEETYLAKLKSAQNSQEIAQGLTLGASIISLIPEIVAGGSGAGGTPVATVSIGGINLGQAAKLGAEIAGFTALIAGNSATMASIEGGFKRRWDDWKLQERLAEKELKQMEKQILAAEIRLNLAEKELENQELQIENAQMVQEYLRSKYTSGQLYNWMVGEV
ncbi:MAG: hypothetical protein JXA23_10950, partial [Bacteroidales bacterium]|nr:hypothetical protein [Bacteroidales bacterium]